MSGEKGEEAMTHNFLRSDLEALGDELDDGAGLELVLGDHGALASGVRGRSALVVVGGLWGIFDDDGRHGVGGGGVVFGLLGLALFLLGLGGRGWGRCAGDNALLDGGFGHG
jgi:hypothetical protein